MKVSRLLSFKEVLSNHLINKLDYLKNEYGKESKEYLSIANQYLFNPLEDSQEDEHNLRHYEADVSTEGVHTVERLYRRHCCIEITFNCFSNCRYCLRSNYGKSGMSDNEIDAAVQYINDNKLEEILISGGDPFVAPVILSKFCGALIENCPSLKIYRIATRTITQSPETIPERVFILLESLSKKVRVEVATQINSAFEFDEETDKVIRRIQSYGITIYSQNVFLRGVNDTPEQLIELYHQMRLRGIEAHYLFHADPIANTHHLRPSVRKMIECYSKLVNSGQVTGRSKPMCAIMSAIGKIILLPDNLLGYVNGYVHLKSRYTLEDRLKYNPNWKMPEEAWVSDDGYLCIEYLDGKD